MTALFGTDGIRGRAGVYPMTVDVAMAVGGAVAEQVRHQDGRCVVIGRDPRISGSMFEAALAAGLAAGGVDALPAGVIPTPGVAFLAADTPDAGAGIMISASHNPFYDNGIKIFDAAGHKLTDEQQTDLEVHILERLHGDNIGDTRPFTSGHDAAHPLSDPGDGPGIVSPLPDALEHYVDFLKNSFMAEAGGRCLVLDCANGAASVVARQVFETLGFDVHLLHDKPDGRNINRNCGSQHTEDLGREVRERRAHVGLAFDGDADRLIALDESGQPVTGDTLLAVCARHAMEKGELPGRHVVTTVMSNIGLKRALAEMGIRHTITGVGDRQVAAAMAKTGAVIGGEDSGHMIFSRLHTTGDGILSALQLLRVMCDTGRSLSDLAAVMTVYPQILKNVPVSDDRPDFTVNPAIQRAIEAAETELGDNGRVLVRYSGTQPLLRVMVEGPELDRTGILCDRICREIQSQIG